MAIRGVRGMTDDLSIILNNFKIKEQIIRLKYESKIPINPIFSKCNQAIEEVFARAKQLAEEESKELQELEVEKTNAIENYYKELENKISKMTDRELLEEIYRGN